MNKETGKENTLGKGGKSIKARSCGRKALRREKASENTVALRECPQQKISKKRKRASETRKVFQNRTQKDQHRGAEGGRETDESTGEKSSKWRGKTRSFWFR